MEVSRVPGRGIGVDPQGAQRGAGRNPEAVLLGLGCAEVTPIPRGCENARFADLTLDQDTYEVRRGGRLIELSPTEFRLLRYFMLNPGRVLTRAQLLDHVWDYDFGGSSAVVSTYVTYLRRKLASGRPDLIWTQRAVGYSLRLPRSDESQADSDES